MLVWLMLAGPLARSSYEVGADPMDWPYMRLVDYYEFNWYPMKGDPHMRYNLLVSVSCLAISCWSLER